MFMLWFLSIVVLLCLEFSVSSGFHPDVVPMSSCLPSSRLWGVGSGRHTFVEGESYDDEWDELDALGGDPSFLEEPVKQISKQTDKEREAWEQEILEAGGDPFFLDGNDDVFQDAGPSEDDDEDTFLPSGSLLAAMGNGKGGVMGQLSKFQQMSTITDETQDSPEDDFSDENDDIETIGGDPGFLEAGKEIPTSDSLEWEQRAREIEEMGGDSFFLASGGEHESLDDDDDDSILPSTSLISAVSQGTSILSKLNLGTGTNEWIDRSKADADEGSDCDRSSAEDGDFEWDGVVVEDAHLDEDW